MNKRDRYSWLFVFWLMAWGANAAAEESARTLPPEHPNAAPELTLSSAGQSQLNNDAVLRRQLRDGRSHLEAGRHIEGLSILQQILDRGDDGFVRSRAGAAAELVSIRFEALKLISELSPAGQVVYERLFGTQANQLWEQGRSNRPIQTAQEVTRRYFHSPAGLAAAQWLANRWADHGEWSLAARMFERILSEPVHQTRLSVELKWQAVIALRQAGRADRATEIAESLRGSSVRLVGALQSAERLDVASLAALSRPSEATSRDWPVVAGDSSRSATASGSVPWLKPLWSEELLSHPGEKESMRRWIGEQLGKVPQRVAVIGEPLVVGNQIIFRDAHGIRSVGLQTGQTIWRSRATLPLIDLQAALRLVSVFSDNASGIEMSNAACSGWGHLATNGQSVFAVDYVPVPRAEAATDGIERDEDLEFRTPPVLTRLIALRLFGGVDHVATGDRQPTWMLDGRTVAEKMGRRGGTIHFHGPPCVVDDALYLLGESFSLQSFDAGKESQLNLLAVSAATGELLWWQGLSLVNLPYFHREQEWRLNPLGTPTAARGMLVCPTDTGLTFGVDLVTGRQRWVYDETFGLPATPGRIAVGGSESRQLLGAVGIPAWPVIHDRRVILLPRFSEFVHCLDVESGRLLWRCPRGDALFVGAVTDDLVLLIGDREVRAIPLALDGHSATKPAPVLWSQRFSTVTGRGVRLASNYLLPLKSGRIACLDLATGRERGHSLRSTHAVATKSNDPTWLDDLNRDPVDWPGNLVAAGGAVVSMGPTRITAYPQAESVLAKLREQPDSTERRINEIELGLLLDSHSSALSELQEILREPLPQDQREVAELLLREAASLELGRRPQDADELLAAWRRVSHTPEEHARLLRRTCEVLLMRDPVRVAQAVRDLVALPAGQPIDMADTGLHVVSADTWTLGVMRQIREQTESAPALRQRVAELIRDEADRLMRTENVSDLRRFVRVYGDWPESTPARFRLASLLADRGIFQEAEFLLALQRDLPDQESAATATARLARLYDRLGLHRAAGRQLEVLNDRFGDQPVSAAFDGNELLSGRDVVARWTAAGGPTSDVWSSRQAPEWPIRRVAISEERGWTTDAPLLESYGEPGAVSQKPRTPTALSFDLVERDFRSRSQAEWQVIDKESGVVVGRLSDMWRVYQPGFGGSGGELHFVPLAGSGQFRGASLLEREGTAKVWEYNFGTSAELADVPRVGPYGPEFCAFQTKQHLIVLDPSNGELLWRRGPLEPQGHVFADQETGLFGDREALVAVETDVGASYVVFETRTGRELRRGKLNFDPQVPRRVIGRHLLFTVNADNQRRVRLWDPLTDQFLIDEPIGRTISTQPQSAVTEEGELLLVLPSGRVRLIDVERREVKLDVQLRTNAVLGMNGVPRAFHDRGHIYVNIRRGLSDTNRRYFSAHLTDSPLSRTDIEGELHAFARPRQTRPLDLPHAGPLGRHLWSRSFSPRSVLNLSNVAPRLPFLVMISQRREQQRNSPLSLHVEAIDADTGHIIGEQTRLHLDRLVHSRLDSQAGRLSLHGVHTAIHLDFGPDRQLFDVSEEPL